MGARISASARVCVPVLAIFSCAVLAGCGGMGNDGGGGGRNLTNPVTGLTAAAGNAQVTLHWNTYPGAISYDIVRSTTSAGAVPGNYLTGGIKTTSYVDVGSLANGTTYYYVVVAETSASVTNPSNVASATPASVPATLTSISLPSVMAGSPSFALTLSGSNFAPGNNSLLVWNGGQQIAAMGAGQFPGNPTQATYTIPDNLIANSGSVSLAVIDSNHGTQPSNSLTFTVDPRGQTACALFGTYAFLLTGYNPATFVGPFGVYLNTIAGVIGVDANGNVNGAENLVYGNGGSFTGTCTNSATPNEGTLTLNPTDSTSPYISTTNATFVLQQGGNGPPRGRLADLGRSMSGMFVAASSANLLTDGDYIFGFVGEDPFGAGGVGTQVALAGRFTLNSGNVSSGVADVNDGGVLTSNVPVSGTLSVSAPGAATNGSLNLTIGAQPATLRMYLNSGGGGFLLGSAFITAENLIGFISPQANAGSYSNSSLNTPFVFTTWGAPPGLCCPVQGANPTDTTIGLASGFDTNNGTFDLLFDNVSRGTANLNQSVSGATYNVASNGRATVSYTSGGNTVNYVYYLDNVSDGYILGQSGNTADFGFFQPQASGPFSTASLTGTFASGTFPAFQQLPTPNLATEITLNSGTLSASTPAGALTGTYSVAASGRGTATVNVPSLGGIDLVLYVIDSQNVVLMGGDNTMSDAITFLSF